MTSRAQTNGFRPGLSVVLSVHNEEQTLAETLESVAWADEIVVVDSGSGDATAEIASRYAHCVIRRPNALMLNINKNIAIDYATCEWVLVLDGDERVSPPLRNEIRAIVEEGPRDVAGYWIPRVTRALGRPVKAFGWFPDHQLRLFRNGTARYPCRDHHEHVALRGDAGQLEGELLHDSFASVWDMIAKANLSSESRARRLYEEGARFSLIRALSYPPYYFAKQYFLRGGFRYGVLGLAIASITSFNNLVQSLKLWSLQREEARILPPGFAAAADQTTSDG